MYKRGLLNSIIYNNSLNINFEKRRLSDFSLGYGGYAFSSKSYVGNGKYKVITIGNVTCDRYINTDICNRINKLPNDLQKHQLLNIGDIVISMTGNVGRIAFVNEKFCLLNQRVAKIEISDKYIREYIYQVLSSNYFEKAMINCGQGAAQKNIKNSDIENYEINYPQNIKQLKAISKLFFYIDKIIEKNVKLFHKSKLQKRSLLQQLFI